MLSRFISIVILHMLFVISKDLMQLRVSLSTIFAKIVQLLVTVSTLHSMRALYFDRMVAGKRKEVSFLERECLVVIELAVFRWRKLWMRLRKWLILTGGPF